MFVTVMAPPPLFQSSFGAARHYCPFLRQSAHNSPLFLVRPPVPPNVHRCELRFAHMKILIYVPYAKGCFETVRQHSILHPERIVGKNEAACAADASREVVERWLPGG